jgi:hypothetical protein
MSEPFDHAWAEETVRQLAAKGVKFAPGMLDRDIDAAAEAFGTPLPAELASFLRVGVPRSKGWAAWRKGAAPVAKAGRAWVDRGFEFDVRRGQYWHPFFGHRPSSDDAAVEVALAYVRAAPPLFPIHGHKFISSMPADAPRPVLSVWQAIDSIYYGNDLADYLARQFGIDRQDWAASEPSTVPVWGELFDLEAIGLP